jgi:hypothetical protein
VDSTDQTRRKFEDRIRPLLAGDGRSRQERDRLVRLMSRFAELPPPPDPDGCFPRYEEYRESFLQRAADSDGEALEEAFLHLYSHLHMHEASYTPRERSRKDETGGYWAHAGGLSPILKAGPWIGPDSISLDLGAGNGLQGLLFQMLSPHRKAIQVEISSHMIAVGKRLQQWLGVPGDRMEWVVGDVCTYPVKAADFVYLYRPVRPTTAGGHAFYRNLAETLNRLPGPVVVFSVADCLGSFVSERFEVFYTDGHLTCFRSTDSR